MIVCVNCKKQHDVIPEKQCECGGTCFALGKLNIMDDQLSCECGCDLININSYADFSNSYQQNGICEKCKNPISFFGYRNKDNFMFCEDDEE